MIANCAINDTYKQIPIELTIYGKCMTNWFGVFGPPSRDHEFDSQQHNVALVKAFLHFTQVTKMFYIVFQRTSCVTFLITLNLCELPILIFLGGFSCMSRN